MTLFNTMTFLSAFPHHLDNNTDSVMSAALAAASAALAQAAQSRPNSTGNFFAGMGTV